MLLRPGRGGVMVGTGGMETWARVRSSTYGLMCGSLLPFSRRRGRVQDLQNSAKAGCLLVRVGAGYQSGLLENSPKSASSRVRVWGMLQLLLENSPKALSPPGLPVRCRPGAGCGKRIFPAKRAVRKWCRGVWRHGAGGDPPPMPQCVGLSCRFSGRAGRVQ